jgi:hypothetical protein
MTTIQEFIRAEADMARALYGLPFDNIKVTEEPGSMACTVACFGEWAFAPTIDEACADLAKRLATPDGIAKEKRARAARLMAEADVIERARV